MKSQSEIIASILKFGIQSGDAKIRSACEELMDLIRDFFEQSGNPVAKTILDEFIDDPDSYEVPLSKKLESTKADVSIDKVKGVGYVENIQQLIQNFYADPAPSANLETTYLNNLVAQCEHLDLTAIDEDAPDSKGEILVSDVFTTLYLKDLDRGEDETVADAVLKRRLHDPEEKQKRADEKRTPIKALDAVGALPRLIILGRPGGGKSTLVNHLCVQTALFRQGKTEDNPLPPLADHPENPMPVRIILRRFASEIPDNCLPGKAKIVWDYLKTQLTDMGCEKYFDVLHDTLNSTGGIVFFDGLDEVRQEDDAGKRSVIVEAIKNFARPLKKCRVVVTCREYAYKKSDHWRLPEGEFPEVEMDLFHSGQIRAFTQAWYRKTGPWEGWSQEQCDEQAKDLADRLEEREHLREIAQYPLLLTLMTQVHKRTGLPNDRADLYNRAVKLLLTQWEYQIDKDYGKTVPSLITTLKVSPDTLRSAMEKIALDVHEQQGKQDKECREGCADIGIGTLREKLGSELNDYNKAGTVIRYIQNRAGLLQGEDNTTFRFPHRTFQEYLAACGVLKKEGNPSGYLRDRLGKDLSWWREVFLLAAGSNRGTSFIVHNLVNTLLPLDPRDADVTEEIALLSVLAARALYETEFSKVIQAEALFDGLYKRVQNWLLKAMSADEILTPQMRCDAGNALNWLGDPRFDPNKFYLPIGDDCGFIKIPDRPFMMAKYPVTVAQYRTFAEATGRELDQRWWEYNRLNKNNHPVVSVSWKDAVAYCEWLTEQFKDENRIFRLPTEKEWEWAATGGDKEREYPCGKAIEPNHVNYRATGIGTTSPVGCFPKDRSPFGVFEMTGNVREWCQDKNGSIRVYRGGSWSLSARYCRSAYRISSPPGHRYSYLGFRLARSYH